MLKLSKWRGAVLGTRLPHRPGEFLPHVEAGVLLYHPRSPAEAHGLPSGAVQAVLPVLETLLEGFRARDIRFEHVSFEHSTWTTPSRDFGYLERYGGVLYRPCTPGSRCFEGPRAALAGCGNNVSCQLVMSPAAAVFRASADIAFTGCTFQRLGAWGLALSNGTQRSQVLPGPPPCSPSPPPLPPPPSLSISVPSPGQHWTSCARPLQVRKEGVLGLTTSVAPQHT